MKLEQQVTSLELSKKLKELGVKQESYFFHALTKKGYTLRGRYTRRQRDQMDMVGVDMWSAFTVAELGEMLQKRLEIKTPTEKHEVHRLICEGQDTRWMITYVCADCHGKLCKEYADTEADARAKMLIYLLENKLI